ncbi:lipocalin family protein [Spirosoma sp. KNUC1025]|uniref:lipocalin family protein n=1 Tax=Spirosoma sp. KNUC1025 TaxID=2894082 RepID=UPI00386A7659|nr:lipocalin family protein [Spirosoma sp. KNUC1025]
MKRYLYSLCFVVALMGLNACSKSSDPAPDPLVGSWKLDRIRTSGIPAPFSTVYLNTDNDPTLFNYQDSFTTKTDKTFTGTVRASGQVIDYNGNWESSGTTLTLKDSQGNSDSYTLDATKTPNQLLGAVVAASDSLTNPTTQKDELVRYNVQLIYVKQ